jgi:hypothetical protein
MSNMDITPEQYLELGMTRKALILDLVNGIDSDLLMLAKDEYAANDGATTVADRATRRLMNLVALIEPDLININPEENA